MRRSISRVGVNEIGLAIFIFLLLLGVSIFNVLPPSPHKARLMEEAERILTEKPLDEWNYKDVAVVIFYFQEERFRSLDRLLGAVVGGGVGWGIRDYLSRRVGRHRTSSNSESESIS